MLPIRLSIFVSIFLVMCIGLQPAGRCEAASKAEKRLAGLLPKKARWSLVVLDRESGRERLAWGNARNSPLVPGSLVKLITGAAALDALDKKEVPAEAFVGRETGKRKKGKAASGPDAGFDRYLRRMNVHSVNWMAENLLRRLGERRFGPPPTSKKGLRAITRYLSGFDLPKGEVTIADGSGLSRKNRVTARAMSAYLYQLGKRPWAPRFLATLPRPGVEGTARNLGYVNRNFRVKTGHLDDVFALAGFGNDREGRGLVFVFLVNFPGRGNDFHHSRGYLMKLLAEGDIPRAK